MLGAPRALAPMRLVLLVLAVATALPAAAQLVPDEFATADDSFADRARRDLVERHRGFLSGLYAQSSVTAGPQAGAPAIVAGGALEGGYRFDSGDAVSVVSSYLTPLVNPSVNPLDGPVDVQGAVFLGAQAVASLARFAPGSALARRLEVGLGASALFSGGAAVPALEVAPRFVVPLSVVTSLPVGLRVSHELGEGTGRGTFVGLTVGVRRIWADEARLVLE